MSKIYDQSSYVTCRWWNRRQKDLQTTNQQKKVSGGGHLLDYPTLRATIRHYETGKIYEIVEIDCFSQIGTNL